METRGNKYPWKAMEAARIDGASKFASIGGLLCRRALSG